MAARKPDDEYYMRRALHLARKGEGRVSPNPMVGAVLVKGERIIGEGYHRKFGGKHAEIEAFDKASESSAGADLYLNLEPCTYYGKTPPCTERVIAGNVARVIIGTPDPNPLVSGRGIKALRRAGIKTGTGVLAEECRSLNEKFFKYMKTGLPFITVKYAQSLDGRIASGSGDSKWISSAPSLKLAHRERALHDAVIVGIGTVLKDDPELTVRLTRGKNPLRVVIDPELKIPLGSKLVTQKAAPTLVATVSRQQRALRLQKAGVEIFTMRGTARKADLKGLLTELGRRGISSVLVEGGSGVITSFLQEDLADRLLAITAPLLIGKGIEAVQDLNVRTIAGSIALDFKSVFRSGDDVVFDCRIRGKRRKGK